MLSIVVMSIITCMVLLMEVTEVAIAPVIQSLRELLTAMQSVLEQVTAAH